LAEEAAEAEVTAAAAMGVVTAAAISEADILAAAISVGMASAACISAVAIMAARDSLRREGAFIAAFRLPTMAEQTSARSETNPSDREAFAPR
jgi:hypothetical protein